MTKGFFIRAVPFAALVAVISGCLTGVAMAQEERNTVFRLKSEPPKGMFAALPPRYLATAQTAFTPTIPFWTGSFVAQGATYTYEMVGASPTTNQSTTVTTYIIPIKMVYSSGSFDPQHVLSNGQTVVQNVTTSPLFVNSSWVQGGTDLGTTQYIDAYQRGSLWQFASGNSGYHVLLSSAVVLPEQTIIVPNRYGKTATVFGVKVGLADVNFFDAKVQAIISRMSRITPNSFPIILTYNVYLTQGGSCCIGGYHSAFGSSSAPQTYAYSTYISKSGVFAQDVAALSHEVGEWAEDPFTTNNTPCGALEVGDPLVEHDYAVTLSGFTYHVQDLVFLSYFSSQSPSQAVNGWYSFQNEFAAPCQ